MDKTIRLSIIIPAYNAEQYLEHCVDSCENQDIPKDEYEVIIINDGSKDNTLGIAKSLADKYSNILLLSQENQGQAVARNNGIRNSKGLYIFFVDADDYLCFNNLGKLLIDAQNNDLDVLISSYQVMKKDGSACVMNDYVMFGGIVSGRDALLSGLNVASVCARFYKTTFIKDNELLFREGIKHEDVYFNIVGYVLAKRLKSLDVCTYVYQWNEGSTDRSFDRSNILKGIMSDLEIVKLEKEYAGRFKEADYLLSRYFQKNSNSLMVSNIYTLWKKKMKQDINTYICKAKQYKVFPIIGKCNSWKSYILGKMINLADELFG